MSYRPARQSKIIRYEKDRTAKTKGTDSNEFEEVYNKLKQDVKRSSIITRLTQKSNSVAARRISEMKKSTNEISQMTGLKDLRKIYQREQQTVGQLLNQQHSKEQRLQAKKPDSSKIKEGLLGEYKYYQKMEKSQLIQKLIALEFLTQKLYRRNKYLEEKAGGNSPIEQLNRTFY